MTITDQDREQYQAAASVFDAQQTPDYCLPTSLKNVLHKLADRHEVGDLALPTLDIEEICEYQQGMGSTSENVPATLGAEIEDYGYTVKEQINTTIADLDDIINKGTASLPLVELSPDYFDLIDTWNPQPGRRGYGFPHVVVPFKINSERVLYHDPFGEMMVQSGHVDDSKNELGQTEFYELWDKGPHPRWTMWIEQLEQQTLQASLPRGE